MNDTIYREDAIKAINLRARIPHDIASAQYASMAINAIRSVPSADRPQGEWIGCRHEDSEWLSPMADFYKCSICGKIVNLLQMRSYNFCPNCGSRMSKGADDERHDI